MTFTSLLFDVHDRVATITVNRPDKLNALDDATMGELDEAIDVVERRDDIGGVIVTGAGPKAFVAGADIQELSAQGPLDGRARAQRGQAVFLRFERSRKPVIAAVNGFALGGGCELALACHIRVASENAKFGLPEVKLGIGPGYGGTQRLPRLIGAGRALQLILTGEMIDAVEAHRIGIVNRIVPRDELVAESDRLLRQILANGPVAVALCIEAVQRGLDVTLAEGLSIEANHFGLLASTADMHEGMQAFLGKRTPRFSGR
ncbi:MAG: enoyl-CoA hydratase-related protein [Gemmatimonadaceae bacterium]